jgi:hypothetical protein
LKCEKISAKAAQGGRRCRVWQTFADSLTDSQVRRTHRKSAINEAEVDEDFRAQISRLHHENHFATEPLASSGGSLTWRNPFSQ